MAFLGRDEVKGIVTTSLKTIADLPDGNIDNTSLAMLNDDQVQVFLSTLKANINAYPYHLSSGAVSTDAHYDVPLSTDTFNTWGTVGGCIDWITANQVTIDNN